MKDQYCNILVNFETNLRLNPILCLEWWLSFYFPVLFIPYKLCNLRAFCFAGVDKGIAGAQIAQRLEGI